MAQTHRPKQPRVLVIGLDGATFRLIHPMIAAGQLPNLASLMADGVAGELRSTIQPSSEQAWSAFLTGQNNGKHGVYGFQQRRPGTYQFGYVNAASLRAPSL
ncbi:MAG: alkaline phosphatase family protein, partial [Anaerolineae bacterium]|nr:alkaline phosphatase family protein [Anaerolineae bacterium]